MIIWKCDFEREFGGRPYNTGATLVYPSRLYFTSKTQDAEIIPAIFFKSSRAPEPRITNPYLLPAACCLQNKSV